MPRQSANVGGLPVLPPSLQVSFYYRLGALRQQYLGEALGDLTSLENPTSLAAIRACARTSTAAD